MKYKPTYDFNLTIKKAKSKNVIKQYLDDIVHVYGLKCPQEVRRGYMSGSAGDLYYTLKYTERKDDAASTKTEKTAK